MNVMKIAAYLNRAFYILLLGGFVLWVVGILSTITVKAWFAVAGVCLSARYFIRMFSKEDKP